MKVRSQILSRSVARGISILCAAPFVIGAPSPARAAGVVGTGTTASCTAAALDAALAGGGLVTFNCGPDPMTIDISTGTGTKTIASDTIIDGAGIITISGGISGGNSVGIFSVNSDVNFTVQNLTITDGAGDVGGGIYSGGTLIVTNCTFIGNSSGIYSNATLTVTNSTFRNNAPGGGIVNGGDAIVTNSTFTGNSTHGVGFTYGGGISILGSGTLTVTSSTFTGNSPGSIYNEEGYFLLRNTILANSPSRNCSFGITDGGHNLDDGTSCGFSAANGSLSNTDPQLDPAGLQDNGGPTQTVALCTAAGMPARCTTASSAIDAGDQAVCAAAPVNNLDQRGFLRPGTGHTQCSIGAYEADATAARACTGDCDGGGSVTVDEIITLVNIALGSAQPGACAHGVASGTIVDVTLIIQAVNNVLSGCGSGQ